MIRLWRLRVKDQAVVLGISGFGISIIVLAQSLITGYLFELNGLPFHFTLTMFIFPVLTIVSALPITPLGLGVGQLAVGQAFQLFGLPAEIGVAVTTLSQISQAFVSFVCGGFLFWWKRPQPITAATMADVQAE